MNRKLKALGLALVAVLAISAMAVSSASASTLFTSEEAHTILSGSQIGTDVFTVIDGKTVKCNEATYAGTGTSSATAEQSVTPSYSECTAFGFVSTKIDTNGCSYKFTAAATNSVHINCPTSPITVTAFNCEVTVPTQTVTGGITYDNAGAAGSLMDVNVTVNLTGITYIQHSKSFPGCTTKGTSEVATSLFHDGKYTGEATIRAFSTTGSQIGITVD